jgi:hypothetical protein
VRRQGASAAGRVLALGSLFVVFNDRDAVLIWIIDNQLSRRNLPPYPRTQLALKKEEIFSKKAKDKQREAGGDKKSDEARSVVQNSAQPIKSCRNNKVRDEIAKLAGVSHDTVARVKVINAKASEADKEALAKGEKSINEVYNDRLLPLHCPHPATGLVAGCANAAKRNAARSWADTGKTAHRQKPRF